MRSQGLLHASDTMDRGLYSTLICHKPYPTLQETWKVFEKILYQEMVNDDDITVSKCFDDSRKDLCIFM